MDFISRVIYLAGGGEISERESYGEISLSLFPIFRYRHISRARVAKIQAKPIDRYPLSRIDVRRER